MSFHVDRLEVKNEMNKYNKKMKRFRCNLSCFILLNFDLHMICLERGLARIKTYKISCQKEFYIKRSNYLNFKDFFFYFFNPNVKDILHG